MAIDWDAPIQTRDGHKVRIYARDGAGTRRIHGAFLGKRGWQPCTWLPDGKYLINPKNDGPDLINTPYPSFDQTCPVSVRDVYGDRMPEAPDGYRFKVEDGKVEFRPCGRKEFFLTTGEGFASLGPTTQWTPVLILEPEAE